MIRSACQARHQFGIWNLKFTFGYRFLTRTREKADANGGAGEASGGSQLFASLE